MSKYVIVPLILLVATSSVLASEERAKEVAQPIVAEDAIFLSRVTFVNHHDMSWGGLVDYTCDASFVVNESGKAEDRNAANIAGIKSWVDPREVVTDPRARYFGAELGERTLLPGNDAKLAELRFDDWLNQSPTSKPTPPDGPARAASSARRERGGRLA